MMNDTDMTEPGEAKSTERAASTADADEPLHAGYTRFELELEVGSKYSNLKY